MRLHPEEFSHHAKDCKLYLAINSAAGKPLPCGQDSR
jgi:hypothetical protein